MGRLLAAAIEANHDDKGMLLPWAIAPFEVYLAGLNLEDEGVRIVADRLYEDLTAAGLEVLFDDRDEAPGVKFNDADLIGPPVRAVISRRTLANNGVEIKRRRDSGRGELNPLSDAVPAVKAALES